VTAPDCGPRRSDAIIHEVGRSSATTRILRAVSSALSRSKSAAVRAYLRASTDEQDAARARDQLKAFAAGRKATRTVTAPPRMAPLNRKR